MFMTHVKPRLNGRVLLPKFYSVIGVALEVDGSARVYINQSEHFTIDLENKGAVVKRKAIGSALFE
jgi:hypothetical protein